MPGAVAYHVAAGLHPDLHPPGGGPPGLEIDSPWSCAAWTWGTYFWKVAALDKVGMEGSFSDFSRFVVRARAQRTQAAPHVDLETLEARGNILQVKGKTESGASFTVNGQRIDVGPDGTFNEYITLEAGRSNGGGGSGHRHQRRRLRAEVPS